jgi:O-antigen/teichoic acid export membrane protein
MTITKNKKKFTFDVGWTLGSSIVILLLHFFQKPIMARYLGPGGFGLFSMAIMIAGVFELIALFGINNALVKFVAEHKENEGKVSSLFSSAFITILIIGMIASFIMFVSSDTFASIFNMPSLSLLLKIYALALPLTLAHGVIISLFMGLREMRYFAFIRILGAFLALALIIALLMIGLGVEGATLGTVFAIIVAVGIAMVLVKRLVHFTFSDYKKNTKMLASFGSRLAGASMVGYIYTSVDTLMIGYFLTSTDVGYYEAATSLSRFFWLVPNAIGIVAYPAISEYWARKDIQAINTLVNKATKYSACLLTFAGMVVILFAKDIITSIFTPEFLPAVLPLIILIIGTVTYGILVSLGSIFAGVGRPDLTLKVTAVGAVGNILLNAVFIPLYGIIGAATATTTARILFVIIAVYLLRKVLAIKFDTFWYIKMGSLIGTSAILFYALGFLNYYISSAIVLIFYATMVIKHFLTKEDKIYFVNIVKDLMHAKFTKR